MESARDSGNDDLLDFSVPDDDVPIMRHQVPPSNLTMPGGGAIAHNSELYSVPKTNLGVAFIRPRMVGPVYEKKNSLLLSGRGTSQNSNYRQLLKPKPVRYQPSRRGTRWARKIEHPCWMDPMGSVTRELCFNSPLRVPGR